MKALRDLAALSSPNGSSSEAVAESVARVRSAARSYADAIGEVTGWDDVFADLDEGGETDDEPFDEVLRLSLAGRWDVRRYVEQGMKTAGSGWTVRHVGRALSEMSHADRWEAGF